MLLTSLLLICCFGFYVDANKTSPPLITIQQQPDEILAPVKRSIRITSPPQDDIKLWGHTVTFRCSAETDTDLEVKINWLKNGIIIDYTDPRFTMWSNNMLQISNAQHSDTGVYTCVAYTDLENDRIEANATLIVNLTPNAPKLLKVDCFEKSATISWEFQGDNNSPIQFYSIQSNTSFTPDTWETVSPYLPPSEYSYNIAMSPWTNHTFRVTAFNEFGPSLPSDHSQACTTQEDVPYYNPRYVTAKGTKPNIMEISWMPMSEAEHNAPNFYYRVSWKKDVPTDNWQYVDISDWTQSSHIIYDMPVLQRYRIKVMAYNQQGAANELVDEVIVYSGEGKPSEAPGNLTVIEVTSPEDAVLEWIKVPDESVNGNFKGYKIEIWVEDNPEHKSVIYIKRNVSRAVVSDFLPNKKNFARIMVYNGRYDGPPSKTVSFTTLESTPGLIRYLDIVKLGSSAFWLSWEPPQYPNGQLTGYNIYYQIAVGTHLKDINARVPQITNPNITSVKLAGLQPDTKYRLYVRATTKVGEGSAYVTEMRTLVQSPVAPDIPNFMYQKLDNNNTDGALKVQWRPADPHAGSHFFAKYRKEDEPIWINTAHELNEDYLNILGLEPNSTYEIRVGAVDGEYVTESQSQFVEFNLNIL